MHLLDAPTRSYKLIGQPVEQFGVRWRATTMAKVARGVERYLCQSGLAICGSPSRARVMSGFVRAGDPFGQRDASSMFVLWMFNTL